MYSIVFLYRYIYIYMLVPLLRMEKYAKKYQQRRSRDKKSRELTFHIWSLKQISLSKGEGWWQHLSYRVKTPTSVSSNSINIPQLAEYLKSVITYE